MLMKVHSMCLKCCYVNHLLIHLQQSLFVFWLVLGWLPLIGNDRYCILVGTWSVAIHYAFIAQLFLFKCFATMHRLNMFSDIRIDRSQNNLHIVCIFIIQNVFHLIFIQKDNSYQPYAMDQVRHIAWQLCKAVRCKYSLMSYSLNNLLYVFCWSCN